MNQNRVSAVILLVAAVVLSHATASGITLTGGRKLRAVDRDGIDRDVLAVKFAKDPAITAPLPDPTAVASRVRVRSESQDTGWLELQASLWEARGTDRYRYVDTRESPGPVAKVVLKTRNGEGTLSIVLRHASYGATAVHGPLEFVEIRFEVGAVSYCGRFAAPTSTIEQNGAGEVIIRGPTVVCGPVNVILMIGDGMGPEQAKAGGIYENGTEGSLSFEALPYTATATTHSASSSVTDSAAAATAMATGVKVNNGVLSMALPGDGGELETILERARARGLAAGLVTTTFMTDATPAAFGAHEPSRSNYNQIADDYLNQTTPEVLLGGGAHGLNVSAAQAAGYTVVTDRDELLALDTSAVSRLSGQFGSTHLPYEYDGLGELPHLSEMAAVALDVLDNDPEGLFLMIEGGLIDHACHANDINRAVPEVVEFDNTFDVVWSWASGRKDTLLIVTADHETGGLTVTANNGPGVPPSVTWSTTGHTSTNVGVYAWGLGAEQVTGVLDNTDIYAIAASVLD